jgi:UDP-N-acetyl-D-mannosaminuronic acid dehydrogenase
LCAKAIPSAGFVAGPCLFKDTMQLAAFSKNQFNRRIGYSAMLVNEGLPSFLVDQIRQQYPPETMTVGLLGWRSRRTAMVRDRH